MGQALQAEPHEVSMVMSIDHPLLQGPYIKMEARKRGISPQVLVEKLMEHIASDQMVLAILDDAETVRDRQFPMKATG